MRQDQSFIFPRQVLLVVIERRCIFADCASKNQLGLTRKEAINYNGFACVECNRWNEDHLNERDVPEWWSEIKLNTNSNDHNA